MWVRQLPLAEGTAERATGGTDPFSAPGASVPVEAKTDGMLITLPGATTCPDTTRAVNNDPTELPDAGPDSTPVRGDNIASPP